MNFYKKNDWGYTIKTKKHSPKHNNFLLPSTIVKKMVNSLLNDRNFTQLFKKIPENEFEELISIILCHELKIRHDGDVS